MKKERKKINNDTEERKCATISFRGIESQGNHVVIEWMEPERMEDWNEVTDDDWEVQFMSAFIVNGHRFRIDEWGEHIIGPDENVYHYANHGWAHNRKTDEWRVITGYEFQHMPSYDDPLDAIFIHLGEVPNFNFRPCALCGKLGEVVLTEVCGWYNLEVRCPDACDEGGFGEDNILFGSKNPDDVREWADDNSLDFDSIRAV